MTLRIQSYISPKGELSAVARGNKATLSTDQGPQLSIMCANHKGARELCRDWCEVANA